MGQCSSYDDVEAMDTSIANAIIAKSDIFGVVLPSNISPGVFVQVAGDKNDKNDDTLLGGMRTSQATTLTLFSERSVRSSSKLQVQADQTKRKHSIESMLMCQSIRQCSAYGKHPAVRVLVSPDGHVTSGSNVTNACIHSEACMMDLTWALVRMPPLKLFGVDLFPSEMQRVLGWSGFNAAVHSCVPVLTNIGYCTMIDGSPTEFWPRSAIV